MLTTIFHWLVLDTITLLFNGNVGDTLHGLALAVRLFALSLIAFLLFLAYDAHVLKLESSLSHSCTAGAPWQTMIGRP